MIDKQGRGDYTDESRIERNNQRPVENPKGDNTAIPHVSTQVRDAIASTLKSTENTGNTMSGATSFAAQVELLRQLKQYLSNFQDRLQGVSTNYGNRVNELHGAGMMDETYQRYVENELAQTQAMISRLIEHISANDIPKVESEIAYLEQKT